MSPFATQGMITAWTRLHEQGSRLVHILARRLGSSSEQLDEEYSRKATEAIQEQADGYAKILSQVRSDIEADIVRIQSAVPRAKALDLAMDRGELTSSSSPIDVVEARESLLRMLESDFQHRLAILHEFKTCVLSRAYLDPQRNGTTQDQSQPEINLPSEIKTFLQEAYRPGKSSQPDLAQLAQVWDTQPTFKANVARNVAAVIELAVPSD